MTGAGRPGATGRLCRPRIGTPGRHSASARGELAHERQLGHRAATVHSDAAPGRQGGGSRAGGAPFNRGDHGYSGAMTNRDEPDDGVWRDEERLPLSELTRAMATNSQDGQVDDLTGSDAGAEEEFGHGPIARDRGAGEAVSSPGDPDPDSEAGRRLRPSPDGTSSDGRSGPN
jgi:hypothetical protein